MKSSLPAFFALLLLQLACAVPVRAGNSERMEYNITWVGVSVATMTVQGETDEANIVHRSIQIHNRPWLAAIYPVDTAITCEIEQTPQGPRHTVTKKVAEREFKQDDTLVLLPDQGLALWSNAINHTASTSVMPKGSRDLVSFLFDLREIAGKDRGQATCSYPLAMDGAVHSLDITTGPAKTIRTPYGRMEAIPVKALSTSPTVFSRNRPRSVWVAAIHPVVIFADVESRYGPVRATLTRWEVNGSPARPGPPR